MPQFRISLVEKFFRPLKKMAEEYGMSMSDIISEAVEWILDQEAAFRKDLEAELPEESEELEEAE